MVSHIHNPLGMWAFRSWLWLLLLLLPCECWQNCRWQRNVGEWVALLTSLDEGSQWQMSTRLLWRGAIACWGIIETKYWKHDISILCPIFGWPQIQRQLLFCINQPKTDVRNVRKSMSSSHARRPFQNFKNGTGSVSNPPTYLEISILPESSCDSKYSRSTVFECTWQTRTRQPQKLRTFPLLKPSSPT